LPIRRLADKEPFCFNLPTRRLADKGPFLTLQK